MKIDQRKRAALLALVVGATGLAVQVLPASPAGATSPDFSATPSLAAPLDQVTESEAVTSFSVVESGPTGASRPEGIIEITCTTSVQNPHNSNHVDGMVNVTATVDCTSSVSSITMSVGLYRGVEQVAIKGFSSWPYWSYLKGNAAAPCVDGSYTGAALSFVVFPPGFYPPTGTMAAVGPSLSVVC